jgi:hypothetical protein
MNEAGLPLMVLIPAFNEAEGLGKLIGRVRAALPGARVVVVNDGSTDATAAVARAAGAVVLDLPCNLGVGGAVQTGFQYAVEEGFDEVVRLDGDGQHPPEEVVKLLARRRETGADLVIGIRFGDGVSFEGPPVRRLGIRALAVFLSVICRTRVSDPTSGFWLVGGPLLRLFAREYPGEYPEPEAIALLRRQGFTLAEASVRFEPRRYGVSTIQGWGTIYYVLKVGLALFVERLRPMDNGLSKAALLRTSAAETTPGREACR